MEKSSRDYLSQLTSQEMKLADSICIGYGTQTASMPSMVFPAKVLNLNSDHKETSDKLKVRAVLQNPQPVPWKTISVMKDKEKQMNVNT